jgi:release factor glutamine methyltransferase
MTTAPVAPTVTESLERAARTLSAHGESPRLDAELLLCHVTGWSRSALIVRGAETPDPAALAAFEALIARRARGAPVAYLTGSREFWSLPLKVTPDVLVPRPETELLVERALALLPENQPRSLLDLGTGSGAIALALASERPRARITAVDVSAAALCVARHNAGTLGLERIEWRLGSWFAAVPGEKYDLIVANPPYVAAGDAALSRLHAEPLLALTPGPSGLEALRAIIEGAAAHLHPEGWLLLEHGCDQADAVAELLAARGFTRIGTHADAAARPRVTMGAAPTSASTTTTTSPAAPRNAPGIFHDPHHSSHQEHP